MATLDTKYQGIAAGNANDAMRAQADMLRAQTLARTEYAARMAAQNPQTLALQQEQMRATTGRLRSGSALDNAQAGQAQAQTGVINYAQGMLQDFDSKAGGSGNSSSSPGAPNPANSSPYAASLGTFGMPSMATPSAPRQTSDVSVDTPHITRAMQGSPGGSSPWALTNAADSHAGTHSVQPTHHDTTPEGRLPPDSPGGLKGMQVFKKGTARVPGKGSPKKDTVPAKLAPGEAVLNAPAAEAVGRDNIAAANRRGAMQMGMRPGKGNMPGHYACGTAKVPHYATGTAEVRSNDQRDLLPPVRGAVMTAPGDPRSNLPPVVGGVLSAGPAGGGVDQFMASRGLTFDGPRNDPPLTQPAYEMPMPHIDRGPPVSVPTGPQWSMPQPGGVPLPPMRPAGLGGYASPAPGMEGPQGLGVDAYMAQHNLSFGGYPTANVPTPPSRPASLGAERARAGTFGEAFAAARKQAGGGRGMFDWTNPKTGQTGHYRTNIRGER